MIVGITANTMTSDIDEYMKVDSLFFLLYFDYVVSEISYILPQNVHEQVCVCVRVSVKVHLFMFM